MAEALAAVKYEVAESIDMALYRARILTEAMKKNMVVMRRTKDEWGIGLEFKNEAEKVQWEFTRDLAATHRQLSKTLRYFELELNQKSLLGIFHRKKIRINKR